MENITETNKPVENLWDEVNNGFIKLEKDKAKILIIMNWKLERVEKFKDEKTQQLKKQIEFSADVLSEDGKPTKKVFSTTSKNLISAIGEIVKDRFNTEPIQLRIKKIGEGVKTIYDVEQQTIQK